MSGLAIIILLAIGIPLLAFAVWQFLQEGLVRIDSGSVGLLIVRGKASSRVLTPGAHFVWPFRHQMIQGYPLRELTYMADSDAVEGENDFVDPPVPVRLGDRATATVRYTLRFRLRPDALQGIHERVGPEGIKRLVRDQSRRVVIEEFGSEKNGVGNAFGAERVELEARLGELMSEQLLADGFDLLLFNLRGVDLGSIEAAIEGTVRAKAELDLEAANSEVRRLRMENEAASVEQLAATLSDQVLRYRLIELGREALEHWDGRIMIDDGRVLRVAADQASIAQVSEAPVEVADVEQPPSGTP